MKKRSFLTAILSVLVAALLCIGLVACGGYESLKGQEVADEEAWQEAVSPENLRDVKIQISLKVSQDEEDGLKGGGTGTITVDADGNVHIVEKYTGDLVEELKMSSAEWYQDCNGKFYRKNAEGKWEKLNTSSFSDIPPVYMYGATAVVSASSYTLEDVEYSKEDKGYVLTSSKKDNGAKTVYKISKGKIVGAYVLDITGHATTEVTVTVQYKKQKVTLPTVEEPEAGSETQE